MTSAQLPAPNRPSRIRALCKMYGAPDTLADEMNAGGMAIRQAYQLLQSATGGARQINPAAAEKIRVTVALARTADRVAADRVDAIRTQQVADLVSHYGLTGTRAGAAIAASGQTVELLRGLLQASADPCGRVNASAQAGLLRDLSLITNDFKGKP